MKKGFTLIELLAVIVILAIIALIATPMILGVIDTAKQGSAKSSALGYVEAVEKSMMIQQVNGGAAPVAGEYTVSENGKTLSYTKDEKTYTITVDFKGDVPSGNVTIGSNGAVSGATLKFSKIYASDVTVKADGTAEIATNDGE